MEKKKCECECGKKYVRHQSLMKHKLKCIPPEEKNENFDITLKIYIDTESECGYTFEVSGDNKRLDHTNPECREIMKSFAPYIFHTIKTNMAGLVK